MELKRQIAISALVVIASTVLVYIVLSLLPRTYQSKQVLYFPLAQNGSSTSALSFLSSGGGEGDAIGLGAATDSMSPLVGSSPSTAIGILKSRTCLKTVVQSLDLDKRWNSTVDEAIIQLRGSISAATDENGFLIVSAKSGDPELCVEILSTMHQFMIDRSDELTINVSKQNREFIAERVRLSEESADRAEANFIETARQNKVSDISAVQDMYLKMLGDISLSRAQREAAESQIAFIEDVIARQADTGSELPSQLDALQALGGSPESALGASLAALSVELQQRQLALEDVSRRFTETSEEYRQAKDHVEASEKVAGDIIRGAADSLEDGTVPAVATARLSLISLTATIASMEATIEEYAVMIDQTPAAMSAILRSQTQFEATLSRTEILRAQLEMARIQEQNDPARFEILDSAEPIKKPIAPRKAFLSGVWALFSFVCCGWWVLRQRVQFVD